MSSVDERPASHEARLIATSMGLDEHVPTLASILANRLRRVASRYYLRQFDMGIVEWRVVLCLGANPGITAIEISHITDINKAAISRSMTELERRGWVRIAPKEGNSRHKLIRLTAEGEALCKRLSAAVAERHRLLVSPLTPEETRMLISLMQRLIDHTQEYERLAFGPDAAPVLQEVRSARAAKRGKAGARGGEVVKHAKRP
ncbi:MarR family transcriptional regulator [Ramlibacter sp. AW1]|uniref:MarR family transcriptional regulator n=1 Tax=Ramlibacter aurantiacus TaxID=2801330 RepID=A0A936ZXM1_9BURK|nr:MarR family transcriptional regulator [Ramlibacter aurantiacus]MBL0422970.1 MarR family transcriptional regulator [Ramlibacter aurantiacus]